MAKAALILLLLFVIPFTHAMDNPDTPDYVQAFIEQANQFEEKIAKCTCSNHALAKLFEEYDQFLELSLTHSERIIFHHLKGEAKGLFKSSQVQWVKHQKKENEFITSHWQQDDFGTAYLLSRLTYLANIKKQRIITLYHYGKNYPAITHQLTHTASHLKRTPQ